MPNRIVREAILTSERVCSLGWPEEVFFRRLMSIVDDYGRCEAHPQLLRAKCYPLQTDAVRVADITRWMAACQKSGVIALYAKHGKQYLEIANFGQQLRSASKCPSPSDADGLLANDSKREQTTTDAHLGVSVSVSVSDTPPPPKVGGFEEFWQAYPRKVGKDAAQKAYEKREPSAELLASMLAAIKAQSQSEAWRKDDGQFIPYPATWLNQGRWMDEQKVEVAAPPPVEVWKGPPPMTPEEKAAANEARIRALGAVKRISA